MLSLGEPSKGTLLDRCNLQDLSDDGELTLHRTGPDFTPPHVRVGCVVLRCEIGKPVLADRLPKDGIEHQPLDITTMLPWSHVVSLAIVIRSNIRESCWADSSPLSA